LTIHRISDELWARRLTYKTLTLSPTKTADAAIYPIQTSLNPSP